MISRIPHSQDLGIETSPPGVERERAKPTWKRFLDSTWTVLIPWGASLLAAALIAWQVLTSSENNTIRRNTLLEAQRAGTILQRELHLHTRAIRRLQTALGRTPIVESSFREEARGILESDPEIRRLQWLTPNRDITWTETNLSSSDSHQALSNLLPFRASLAPPRASTEPCLALLSVGPLREELELVVAIPSITAGSLVGYVVGFIQGPWRLADVLGDSQSFAFEILNLGDDDATKSPPADSVAQGLAQHHDFQYGGSVWRVVAQPTEEFIRARTTPKSLIFLSFALTCALLVPGVIYLYRRQISAYRAEAANTELRTQFDRLESAVAACPSGIIMTNPDGKIILANSETVRLFGYALEELIGQEIEILIPKSSRVRHRTFRADYFENPSQRRMGEGQKLHGLRKDGSLFPVEVGLSVVQTSEGAAALSAINDISKRDHAETIVRLRTRQLERSNADLEQFAYVASHDLQEPLRMVASYTDLLAQRYRGRLDAKADKFIGHAVDGARRMQRLLNDLLTYSRATSGERSLEQISAAQALEDALANLSVAIRESGATVQSQDLPSLEADRLQLTQLFQNLIGNAIKFRAPGRSPQVQISAVKTDDGWTFSVRDNGIGIPPQFSEQVFVIFRRLHERNKYPGSGIGLSICKKIVEHHGGRIWVEKHEEQEGTTISFSLPAQSRVNVHATS